ncbi:MAG TPA: VWA domain-containing protein, partial [Bacteroidetes bacterium]|nr:VWA domain-containing protein [Bacteroidota bacterium]
IGTGGTSPFGAFGYNPEGFRIGQGESRHRRAIKVWDERHYQNLDEDQELNTRNIKMAMRHLREFTREGIAEELDLKSTIKETSKNAGWLQLVMRPARKNNVKVLLFFDIGGSMDDHVELCSQFFSAARYEFKHMEFYYFHNCIYESVWKDNKRRNKERYSTLDLINQFNKDYKVIIVGDAAMSPYEIFLNGGSVEHFNEEAGIVWLNRIKDHFENMVWINPNPKDIWDYYQSIHSLNEFMNQQMYPMTLDGIQSAMKNLLLSEK